LTEPTKNNKNAMKILTSKKMAFLIFISFLSLQVFAQTPADPGTDPMDSKDTASAKIFLTFNSISNESGENINASDVSALAPVYFGKGYFLKTSFSARHEQGNL